MKMFVNKLLSKIISVPVAITNNNGVATILGTPKWVGITFGVLFIIMGIALIATYPRSKRKADNYKMRQLEKYNKDTGKNVKKYESTKLFLPLWEKTKQWAFVFIGITLIILGISWITGDALSTKNIGN